MTFEELKDDKPFIEGLRKGEYCLVLGAGFSIGLKNKTTPDSLSKIKGISYNEFNTIPLVSAYVSLTNKIFNDTITKGEAAANIWENKIFSIKKDNEIIDLKPFYRGLFTLDEDWFRKKELNKYKSILLVNWYQVYTFNFDNVFETIVELSKRNDFYSLHFPEHKGDINRKTQKKAIHHLHGYIVETPVENLTFSQETYVYLENEPHTLYDPFHVDVDSGKKLVIIGNQFDERNIDKMFFEGLKKKDITIYHFSRDNSDFRTKPGISGNPNYHFIRINDTHEVLDFFEKNKVQIENIKIEGADVVNSDFIEKVEQESKNKGFTASDFYLAKQVDECQWYGITQNWVVERNNYKFIRQEIISSFDDENRNSKISVLVWGLGGSGKSTLLRQLSADLSNEDFAVLWIKDKSIQSFYDRGLPQLRSEYTHKKFLVVIEDLYRVKQQDVNLKESISSICSNSNVRLIVGDRKNDDSSYKEHIYNPDKNIVELTVDDNKKTLDKLLGNIPDWKTAAAELLKTDDDYKSTLYYILWTIGRTAQKEKEGFSFNKRLDLTSHFRGLVQSDLKALSVNYPGVAKMLYYWASIYAKNKIYIAYDLFFKLAELFNAPSTADSKLILASPVHKSILDIYTHKASGFIKSAGELPLFAFNHDILAEDGLSKSKLSDWHPFDDSVKLTMLPPIINLGDGFSASSFLVPCLRNIPDSVFRKEEKKKWVNTLKIKGVFSNYLVTAINRGYYSVSEKIELANEILSQDNFWNLDKEIVSTVLNISKDKDKADIILSQDNFWNLDKEVVSPALNISKDKDKADIILSQDNFWNLPHQIVSTALNISKDKDKADIILSQDNFWNLDKEIVSTALNISKDKDKADIILSQDNFWNLPHQIVSPALNISKDKDKADIILSQDNFWNLDKEIVSTALNISKDKDKADIILSQDNFWNLDKETVSTALNISKDKNKADTILSQDNFWNLPYQIVSTALNISKDKNKADIILSQDNFWNLPYQIVSPALNISKDKDKADIILSQDNFWNLPYQIVSTALNISKDKDKADIILSQDNFWNLDKEIVSTALNISNNGELKEKVGNKLFESGKWKERWNISYHILYFYSGQKNIPESVNQICKSIISEFLNRGNSEKGKSFRYTNLMKIPLHSQPVWKKSSMGNIRSWRNRPRNLVTNTILAYRNKPKEIKNLCEEILRYWKTELSKPINQIGRRYAETHFGDHTRLSLGHPDLEELAKQTALQIKEAELQSPGLIPEQLLEAVNQIIDANEFPVWNFKNNDEQE